MSTVHWRVGMTTRLCPAGAELHRQAIDLEIRRPFDGHIVFRSGLKAKNYDFRTVEYTATVETGKKSDFLYELSNIRAATRSKTTLPSRRQSRAMNYYRHFAYIVLMAFAILALSRHPPRLGTSISRRFPTRHGAN